MDTDAMVKLTKAGAKEQAAKAFTIILTPRVRQECVGQGKAAGHPDAVRIEENLRRGFLSAGRSRRSAKTEALLRTLRLSGGEADVLRLYQGGGADLVVSDDRRFLRIVEGLGVPFTTPSALLVALVRVGSATRAEGLALLESLAPFMSDEEYLEARRAMEAD